MGNLARKIIDAVQNLLLDKLLERLMPLAWIVMFWQQMQPTPRFEVIGGVLLAVILLMASGWALGALANRRPRVARPGLYDRLHQEPPNGFAAWDELPAGGLQPPAAIRAIVMVCGAGPRAGWVSVCEVLVFMSAMALAFTLSWASPRFWAEVHPGLAEFASRERLLFVVGGVLAVVVVRSWAVQQRYRLNPLPIPGSRRWSDTSVSLTTGIIATGLISMVAPLIGLPVWQAILAGIVSSLVAFGPPWRGRLLDAIFGKREDIVPPRGPSAT